MNFEFMGLLIKCVENYPCLWDTSAASYNKREATEQAWEDISKICGQPEKFCRDKWKNVRTGFIRSIAKRKRFYLYDVMKFLLPILSIRHIESSASQSSLQEQININQNTNNNSVVDEYNSLCDNVVQIEDSASVESVASLEASVFEELDTFENVKVDTTPTTGYFSQFGSASESQAIHNETENNNSEISYASRKRKHRRHTSSNSDEDGEPNKESKEEKALISFFKGISADVLSLSRQNQRFFKRKMVELIDDLHNEEEQPKKSTESSKQEYVV